MGNCIFCGNSAGFLRKQHKECKEKFESGENRIILLIESFVSDDMSLGTLKENLREISKSHFLDENILKSALLKGWKSAAEKAFKDEVLAAQGNSSVTNWKNNFPWHSMTFKEVASIRDETFLSYRAIE